MIRALLVLFAVAWTLPSGADIPRPDRDRESDRFAESVELGPIQPLAPVEAAVSRDGAGRLPEGVIVETEVTRLEPIQRDRFVVTQTIIDPARRLRGMEVHRPEGDGLDARPLSVTEDTVEIDGRQVPRRHYRWAVQALRPGELILRFARIEFDLVGLAQSRFAWIPVARQIEAVALPPHLPEYLPLTPELSVENEGVGSLVAGEPGAWRLRVSGRGLSAEALERMLAAQLVAPSGLRLESPAIREVDPAGGDVELISAWQVSIPLLPTAEASADGRREARLPSLRLPYLRPGGGGDWLAELAFATIEPTTVTWDAPVAEQRWTALRQALPWALVGLLGLVFIWLAGRRLWRGWQARAAWLAARTRLLEAEGPADLRRRLQAMLAALPQPIHPLQRERLVERGAPEAFLNALADLDRLCFAGDADGSTDRSFDDVRAALTESLPRRWFR